MLFRKIKLTIIINFLSLLNLLNKILKKIRLDRINIKFELYLQIYLFKFFNSNHFNRLKLIKELKSSKKIYSDLDPNKDLKKIYFVGDSHVEMYSRSNILNYFHIQPKALWLGPCTVLGTFFTQNHTKYLNTINKYFGLENNDKNINLVLSIGSIDVRTLFYQLLVAKTVENEDRIFTEFEKALDYFIKDIVLKVKNIKKIHIIKIYNSSMVGYEPISINEINKLKEKNEFVTFGSITKRYSWTNKINSILEDKCNQYSFNFINVDIGSDELSLKKYSDDDIHINDMKIINQISDCILNE